ncbi:MAG: DUF1835 domain-containing protein [Rhodobacteraceae bacterium]|nr:DUF1835 domain-containing protein [Paracoccaceae bacterium]
MTMLHITNGDGAADILKHSTVAGDVLPWRDPMHHGPFPSGLDLQGLSRLRARYLAGPSVDPAEAERDFRLRDEHLLASLKYQGVVLWFEHDLLDQLQILQILDWFAGADLGGALLEMVCIDAFPGVEPFRGLGQLTPAQMASLFDQREAISAAETSLAKTGWAAFRSDDPRDLLGFLQEDLSALPFLRAALRRHFEEYPSPHNGLTRTEHQLLSLAADGVSDPVDLFVHNMELETALYLGDWTSFSTIDRLCQASLLSCQPTPFWHPPTTLADRQAFRAQRLGLSDDGARVLSGERDAAGLIHRDIWLGGVHLQSGQPMWRWDAEAVNLVLCDA